MQEACQASSPIHLYPSQDKSRFGQHTQNPEIAKPTAMHVHVLPMLCDVEATPLTCHGSLLATTRLLVVCNESEMPGLATKMQPYSFTTLGPLNARYELVCGTTQSASSFWGSHHTSTSPPAIPPRTQLFVCMSMQVSLSMHFRSIKSKFFEGGHSLVGKDLFIFW